MLSRSFIKTRVRGHRFRLQHCKASAKATLQTKVKLEQGTVIGGEHALPNGNSYYFFKGIPYAVPPLGELRFQAPLPLERFPHPEIDCTNEGDVCFQIHTVTRAPTGSENCLFLNVYAPKVEADKPLPVMVFIHGGRYTFGSGNSDFFTPTYLMQEDVVVVTINYRLAALGFLALPEGNIPGNAGLKDQRLALQWVRENISQFNGDPNNVTLFGESSGAACVHFQVLAESSRKLFHKAIMQSGCANMPWAVQTNPSHKATQLAKLTGCTSDDPLEVAKFLKNHSFLNDFFKNQLAVLTPEERRRGLPIVMRPVIEKNSAEAIVTEEPLKSMKKRNSIDIPIMMGYNSAEGITILSGVRKLIETFDKDFARLIPVSLNLHPDDPKSLELANLIRDFYFEGARIDGNTLNEFAELLGDFHFVIDCWAAAETHATTQHKSPLFFYRFDYVGGLNLFKKQFQFEQLRGACHAEDLFYLFQADMAAEPWTDRDKKMVQTVCKLWANFAKYGNPTPKEEEQFVDCLWEPVDKVGVGDEFTLNAFIIDEEQKMVKNADGDRSEFWRSVYRKYNGVFC